MFEQRIIDNNDPRFPGQVLIVGFQDGQEVWRSWAPADLDPAVRLNVDHPVAVDGRRGAKGKRVAYRVPNIIEAKQLNITSDQHRVLAAYAAVTSAVTVKDAAEAAALDEASLVMEAQSWRVERFDR